MTETEHRLLAQGLATILTVPTDAGKALFGSHYRNFNHFLNQHATAAADPRGDQVCTNSGSQLAGLRT